MSPFDTLASCEPSQGRRGRRLSLQFEPNTPTALTFADLQKQSLDEEQTLERSARSVSVRRRQTRREVMGRDTEKLEIITSNTSQVPPMANEIGFGSSFVQRILRYLTSPSSSLV